MKAIIIGKPYIERDSNNGRIRLCSEITDEEKRTLYYEVSPEYEDYLVVENSDAFVLGLLHHAMNVGKRIICEIGVTEQLLFQLKNYYIPIIASNMPDLQAIDIDAKVLSPIDKLYNGVITGNSGGVDSFYTIMKYKELSDGYKLTHLLFNNISTEDSDEDRIRSVYERSIAEKEAIANEVGLDSINMYTNLYSFYKSHFIYNYYFAAQYCSAAYAVGKLVTVFYFSSAYTPSKFSLDHKKISDSSNFDLFSLSCFSLKNLFIYSSGTEATRIEKMDYIVDSPCVQKHLQVCSEEQYEGYYKNNTKLITKLNCGVCRKCRRTVSMLYCDNKLDLYENVFDLSVFKSNKAKYIGYELATDHGSFSRMISRRMKERDIVPPHTVGWRLFWTIRFKISRLKIVRLIVSSLRR